MKRSKKENKKLDMVFDVMRKILDREAKEMIDGAIDKSVATIAGVRDGRNGDMVMIVRSGAAIDLIMEYVQSDEFAEAVCEDNGPSNEERLDEVLRAMFKDILERKSG